MKYKLTPLNEIRFFSQALQSCPPRGPISRVLQSALKKSREVWIYIHQMYPEIPGAFWRAVEMGPHIGESPCSTRSLPPPISEAAICEGSKGLIT